jgi:hypothetical protein
LSSGLAEVNVSLVATSTVAKIATFVTNSRVPIFIALPHY